MNIYVESNFVLEVTLAQEQQEACENILRLCEAGRARLVVPAFSMTEPYHTLDRRHKQRDSSLGAGSHHRSRSLSEAIRSLAA